MHKTVRKSFLYSSPKLETNQTSSIGGWINEMSYSQNEATGTHTDESHRHIKGKIPDKKEYLLHNAIYMKFENRQSSSMRREVRIVVTSGSRITLEQT